MKDALALPALVLLAALTPPTYVLLNVLAIHAATPLIGSTQRLLLRVWSELINKLRVFVDEQLSTVTPRKIRTLVFVQLGAASLLVWLLTSSQHLLSLTAGLIGYVLIVCAAAVSLLSSFPVIRKVATDPSWRLIGWAIPIAAIFVARGYGSGWVGEIIGASPANAPSAVFAATSLIVAVFVAVALILLSLLLEISIPAFAILATKNANRPAKALFALGCTSFLCTYAGSMVAAELAGPRLGSVLISAIAFEFDAAPAQPCRLTQDERQLAVQDEPIIKAIYLSTSQEKALLVRRDPTLFRPFVFRRLTAVEAKGKRLHLIRTVNCFSN